MSEHLPYRHLVPTPRAALRAACLILVMTARPAAGQQSAGQEAGPTLATREFLQAQLARLDRDRPSEAALIRSRLAQGDFQAGDRIFVRVEGEPQLSDTFTAGPGPALVLPQIGAVPLGGVLRSECVGRLREYLARYLRDPVVQARPLMRILIEGDVIKPGFYAVPPDLALADVVGVAGGLTQRAKVSDMKVQRDQADIWSGEPLRQALGRGLTLDQLSLRAGDRVFVPSRGDFGRTIGLISAIVGIPLTIYVVTRVRR